MVLIDGIYINDGGGKVLLDYLISELEKTDKQIYYLLDKRVRGKIQPIKASNHVFFLSSKFFLRKKFYLENQIRFSSVLCFGNLPPNIKLDIPTFTYFHQLLFLEINKNLGFSNKIIYWLKVQILNSIKQNTDFWFVQTDLVKDKLSQKYNIDTDKIHILAFYPPKKKEVIPITRKPKSYIYVSNATPHKNHERLINAFCAFYDQKQTGELILTVSDDYPTVQDYIRTKQKLDYPIQNLGFVTQDKIFEIYQSSSFLIFPSLTESFGLPLVEAIESGCKVIGADLAYTHAVCKPSITFNPWDTESIITAFCLSLQPEIPNSESKVQNEFYRLFDYLI